MAYKIFKTGLAGIFLVIGMVVLSGCVDELDGCLFNSTCSGCGAPCIKSGFHVGDCEYNHRDGCPFLVEEAATEAAAEEESGEETAAETSSDYSSARSATQAIVSRSERCGRLSVPDRAPTIRIKRYDIYGAIEFESSFGSGSISNTSAHREYMILTMNSAGKVGDSASSHGYKDSRWNKYWGSDLRSFCIVLLRDNRGSIEEWSETVVVR